MSLDTLVTAALETSLNALVRQDSLNQQNLLRLKGRILRVRFTDINKQLVFFFSEQIDILAQFEGEVNCDLALPLSAAPKLKDKSNLTSLIKQDLLQVEGDLDLAHQFSLLLNGLNPDIEQCLSCYTGDVFAHTLVRGMHKMQESIKNALKKQERNVSSFVTEEWRIVPGMLEMASFSDGIEDVKSQASSLEVRLNVLEGINMPVKR